LTDEVCANKQKELSLHHGVVQTQIFGPDGWQPGYLENSRYSHGTAMATALGGDIAGVAKDAKIVPVAYYPQQTRYWFLDALDWILSDWRGRAASLDATLAPLGVLSMSTGFHIDPAAATGYFELRMSRWLRSLVAAGVLPVAAAGNNAFEEFGSVSTSFTPYP
jgi:subtilisin family serine protease